MYVAKFRNAHLRISIQNCSNALCFPLFERDSCGFKKSARRTSAFLDFRETVREKKALRFHQGSALVTETRKCA
jgi:hypothetical protein